MTHVGVTFPSRDPARFGPEVKRRVAEYFSSRKLSDKATPGMIAKTFILLSLTFGSYGLILSGWFGPWAMLGLAVFMGVGVRVLASRWRTTRCTGRIRIVPG
jgi:linoleoyl-CoA desaturase